MSLNGGVKYRLEKKVFRNGNRERILMGMARPLILRLLKYYSSP